MTERRGPIHAVLAASVRHRGAMIALAVILVGFGVLAATRARLDVFPEFAPPEATVQTEAPGLAPEQVETLVTQPLEDALAGAGGVVRMRSRSLQGLSIVTLTFDAGADLTAVRQSVSERLGKVASELPGGVHAPTLLPLTSSAMVVLSVGIRSDTRSLMDLRTLADWTLKPQLLAVPGVSDVNVFGGDLRQVQVQVQPDALARYGLGFDEVAAAAARATSTAGSGFVENGEQRVVLAVHNPATTATEVGATVLRAHDGQLLRLADVATVTDGAAPASGVATVMGRPGVLLVVDEQYGADTMRVTHALDARLAQLAPELKARGVALYPAIFRPANFIQASLGHLREALLVGAALVLVVLLLVLRDARAALISALAIPLSLLAAVATLEHFGVGLNTMTLGGLAIAIGEVVDDAIIDVENILRRLRENRASDAPRPVPAVVLAASTEVRGAVVYATLIVALVFVPVLTLSGVAQQLFAPLGLAYIAAILASLVVAMTVTPALGCVLLAREAQRPEPRFHARWRERYDRLLRRMERHPRRVLAGVVLLCAAGLGTLPLLRPGFLPTLREGHYIVHMRLQPGAALAASERLGERVSAALLRIPGVRYVGQRTGRAERVGDPNPLFATEFEVDLKPLSGAGQRRVVQAIDTALTAFPGASFSVNTFLTERINETLSGYTSPVTVSIYGNDLDRLDQLANETARVLSSVPGARNVQVRAPQGEPQLSVRLRPHALARWGLSPADVLETLQTAYAGRVVGHVLEGSRQFEVSVILPPDLRRDPSEVGRLPLTAPDGREVPLSSVADVTMGSGRFMILHEQGQRVQTLTVDVPASRAADFAARARRALARDVRWPPGIFPVFGGNAEAAAQATRELLAHAALAGAGVVVLLGLALRRRRAVLLVLLNLPFALVGGVAVALLSDASLSLGGLVGFVTLFGISVRNALMLLAHYRELVQSEGCAWNAATARRGAAERLLPILLTALITALGLLPLALTAGAPGNEIEGAMAAVILGGLVTSTLLNLLVLPALAARFLRPQDLAADPSVE